MSGMSGALIFVAATQGVPLDLLDLGAAIIGVTLKIHTPVWCPNFCNCY